MSDFEKDLIASMGEALEIAKGASFGVIHEPIDPKAVRVGAKLTQAQMAPILGMSLSGYKKWEQGQRSLSGPALNLLRVLQKRPDAVLDALGG